MEAEEVRELIGKLKERFRGRKAGERYSIIWSLEEGGIEVFGWGSDIISEAKEIGREILEITKVGVVEIGDVVDGSYAGLLEWEEEEDGSRKIWYRCDKSGIQSVG